jgi:hypothetical protein
MPASPTADSVPVMRVGNALIVAGLLIVAAGIVLRFAPWLVSWFGRLPGDIRIERETSRVFIPITSMLLVSVLASVLLTIFMRSRG